ncbi:MAG: hypothetical protein ACT4OM_09895 [Actinomycetota bacterium]
METLVAVYALAALEGEEYAAVDRHLDVCLGCRLELAEHLRVIKELGLCWGAAGSSLENSINRVRERIQQSRT